MQGLGCPISRKRGYMKNRRHQRIELPNLVADVSDGISCFSGTVIDISRVGIRLAGLPERLNDQAKMLSTSVSVNSKDFKLLVIPKWVSENNSKKQMGFQIIESSRAWTDLIRRYEPMDNNGIY